MMLDRQLQFSDGQAITATAASTDLVDLSAVRNIGAGEELYLMFLVTEAFTDTGSDSTVTPSLQTDDNAAFSSAATVRTYDTLAALTAINTRRFYKLEPFTEAGTYERYIRIMYTVAGGNLTTGKITAAIVKDAQLNRIYPGGYSIS